LNIDMLQPSLENVFIKLTGLALRPCWLKKAEKKAVMLADDLRGLFYFALKHLKAYYFKPPNISWGILFPFDASRKSQPGEKGLPKDVLAQRSKTD